MAVGLIGALRVTLGIDTSEFIAGSTKAQAEMRSMQKEFNKAGNQWIKVGKNLTTYVTAPILGAGIAIAKLAGDFEASMIKVGISSGASTKELAAMREQALMIGKDTSKSASDASNAMDMLAKAGMKTKDILEGGAKAAVNLAIATGSELDPAAAAVTDTMNLFHKTAAQLPDVINKITGAVNESKFDFADFKQGMAQAGGVASAAGMSFNDFTTALAATSSQFQSGSDAGTSFKTFLMNLTPKSKDAKKIMDELGISFYDVQGKMKPLADIAQMLQDKFANMSSKTRTLDFKEMFGTDAIRTAIGLMQLGAKGVEDMAARINGVSATDQAAKRMAGFNGQLEQLKGSLETLAIRIGDSGLLSSLTTIVTHLADWTDTLSKASPETFKIATYVALFAAAMGPLALVFGTATKTIGLLLPLIARLGPLVTFLTDAVLLVNAAFISMDIALFPIIATVAAIAGAVALVYAAYKHWDEITAIVKRMYDGVKTWLGDALHKIFDSVKDKIESVKKWFFDLYDAVVGHSYIPDMVDEIGQHMARLDENLVKPAKKGTDEAAAAFLKLKNDLSNILSRLFPEQDKQNQYVRDLATVEAGMKAVGATAEATALAIAKLTEEYRHQDAKIPTSISAPDGVKTPGTIDNSNQDPWAFVDEQVKAHEDMLHTIGGRTKEETLAMAQEWSDMAKSAVSSMQSMVSSFKSGDILGGIQGILDLVTQVAGLLKSTGVIKSSSSFGVFGGNGNTSGSAPPSPVGFSTGGTFKVGGSGGVDSQMMRFRASPGEMISVDRTQDQSRGSSRAVVIRIDKSRYFDAAVQEQAQPLANDAAVRGATGGSQLAQRSLLRQRRGQLA